MRGYRYFWAEGKWAAFLFVSLLLPVSAPANPALCIPLLLSSHPANTGHFVRAYRRLIEDIGGDLFTVQDLLNMRDTKRFFTVPPLQDSPALYIERALEELETLSKNYDATFLRQFLESILSARIEKLEVQFHRSTIARKLALNSLYVDLSLPKYVRSFYFSNDGTKLLVVLVGEERSALVIDVPTWTIWKKIDFPHPIYHDQSPYIPDAPQIVRSKSAGKVLALTRNAHLLFLNGVHFSLEKDVPLSLASREPVIGARIASHGGFIVASKGVTDHSSGWVFEVNGMAVSKPHLIDFYPSLQVTSDGKYSIYKDELTGNPVYHDKPNERYGRPTANPSMFIPTSEKYVFSMSGYAYLAGGQPYLLGGYQKNKVALEVEPGKVASDHLFGPFLIFEDGSMVIGLLRERQFQFSDQIKDYYFVSWDSHGKRTRKVKITPYVPQQMALSPNNEYLVSNAHRQLRRWNFDLLLQGD